MKQDIRTPESVYFVTPLNLDKDWECTFDTSGVPTKLDDDQLPGASRDWFTVEKFAAMYNRDKCAALICPDAPMIQAGGFNFGNRSKTIERNAKPLLIAWPLNNYWDTNFRPSQPGFVGLRYFFKTYDKFDEQTVCSDADTETIRVETHPLLEMKNSGTTRFLNTSGNGLRILHIKKSDDGSGIVLRVINLDQSQSSYSIELPGKQVMQAYITNTYENILSELEVQETMVSIDLPYRKITTVLIRV